MALKPNTVAPTAKANGTVSMPVTVPANARRLDAAHKHLDRMFADAMNEQIDGRKFWGRIVLEIWFEDGESTDVLASKLARDRMAGGRA